MKVLVLGCGATGRHAVRDLYEYGPFDEIAVATRRAAPARELAESLRGRSIRVTVHEVDVHDESAVAGLMHGAAVAVSCVGLHRQLGVRVARAAIRAKVGLVDLNDDPDAACEILALDSRARAAGIAILLGMGANPGLTNVFVGAAARQLDHVDHVLTAQAMSGTDPAGAARGKQLVMSLSGRALTLRDGRLVEVRAMVDGWERMGFAEPLGVVDVFHIAHPQPITLLRSFPRLQSAAVKGAFTPSWLNDVVLNLGQLVRESPAPLPVRGHSIDPLEFAAAYLQRRGRSLSGPLRPGALRVEVRGMRGGRRRRVVFEVVCGLAHAAGVAAAVASTMMAGGAIHGTGVLCPEAVIEPQPFLHELFARRDVAALEEWTGELGETVGAEG